MHDARKVHHPGEHHHPPSSLDGVHLVLVDRKGMSARLPTPGACFFIEPPADKDPDYVTHRIYLTLPRLDRPPWWSPCYMLIGDGPDCHQWDGSVGSPTITPSILQPYTGTDAERWHGYLTAGMLASV